MKIYHSKSFEGTRGKRQARKSKTRKGERTEETQTQWGLGYSGIAWEEDTARLFGEGY